MYNFIECDRYSKGITFTIIDTPGFGDSLSNSLGYLAFLKICLDVPLFSNISRLNMTLFWKKNLE